MSLKKSWWHTDFVKFISNPNIHLIIKDVPIPFIFDFVIELLILLFFLSSTYLYFNGKLTLSAISVSRYLDQKAVERPP